MVGHVTRIGSHMMGSGCSKFSSPYLQIGMPTVRKLTPAVESKGTVHHLFSEPIRANLPLQGSLDQGHFSAKYYPEHSWQTAFRHAKMRSRYGAPASLTCRGCPRLTQSWPPWQRVQPPSCSASCW